LIWNDAKERARGELQLRSGIVIRDNVLTRRQLSGFELFAGVFAEHVFADFFLTASARSSMWRTPDSLSLLMCFIPMSIQDEIKARRILGR